MKSKKPAIILNLGFILQILIILIISISGIFTIKNADKRLANTYIYLSEVQIVAENAKFDVLTVQRALKDVGIAKTSDRV